MVWYYVKDGVRQGPVEESELRGLVAESVIKSDTLVWHEGMSDWLPFSTAPSTPTPEPIRVPVVEPARLSEGWVVWCGRCYESG